MDLVPLRQYDVMSAFGCYLNEFTAATSKKEAVSKIGVDPSVHFVSKDEKGNDLGDYGCVGQW